MHVTSGADLRSPPECRNTSCEIFNDTFLEFITGAILIKLFLRNALSLDFFFKPIENLINFILPLGYIYKNGDSSWICHLSLKVRRM